MQFCDPCWVTFFTKWNPRAPFDAPGSALGASEVDFRTPGVDLEAPEVAFGAHGFDVGGPGIDFGPPRAQKHNFDCVRLMNPEKTVVTIG